MTRAGARRPHRPADPPGRAHPRERARAHRALLPRRLHRLHAAGAGRRARAAGSRRGRDGLPHARCALRRQRDLRRRRRTARVLLDMADDCGVQATVEACPARAADTPLRVLEQQLFSYTSAHFDDPAQTITVHTADDLAAECAWAAARALQLVQSGCRWRDIAIAVRGFSDYAPALERMCAYYGVPLYFARRTDLLQKPLVALIRAAYDIVTGGWDAEDVSAYLRTASPAHAGGDGHARKLRPALVHPRQRMDAPGPVAAAPGRLRRAGHGRIRRPPEGDQRPAAARGRAPAPAGYREQRRRHGGGASHGAGGFSRAAAPRAAARCAGRKSARRWPRRARSRVCPALGADDRCARTVCRHPRRHGDGRRHVRNALFAHARLLRHRHDPRRARPRDGPATSTACAAAASGT